MDAKDFLDELTSADTSNEEETKLDEEKLLRKKRRQNFQRSFITGLLLALGILLILSLIAGTILELPAFADLHTYKYSVDKIVNALFISSVGVLCFTLGIERKVDFDNIETTLNKIRKSLEEEYILRKTQGNIYKSQLNSISTSLKYIDDKFLNTENSFDIFWGISLLKARARNELIDSETFIINKSNVPKFWLQMINNTDTTWFCTDRIELGDETLSNEFWKRRLSRRGLQIQESLSKDFGVVVKRIFIFDKNSNAQLPILKGIMKEQESMKIKVRWISLESALKDAPLNIFQDKLGTVQFENSNLTTVDFTIINGKYLFSYFMQNKSVVLIKCTSNQKMVSSIKEQYDLLYHESKGVS